MSCHVMSCHVMSCHVMSCHVMSCPFPKLGCSGKVLTPIEIACAETSAGETSAGGTLAGGMAWHVMSCHVTSRHVMSCHDVGGFVLDEYKTPQGGFVTRRVTTPPPGVFGTREYKTHDMEGKNRRLLLFGCWGMGSQETEETVAKKIAVWDGAAGSPGGGQPRVSMRAPLACCVPPPPGCPKKPRPGVPQDTPPRDSLRCVVFAAGRYVCRSCVRLSVMFVRRVSGCPSRLSVVFAV
eukprot:gene15156-biopygen14246